MTNTVLVADHPNGKRHDDQLSQAGELMSAVDVRHRIQRISGALRTLYAVGERLGSRRLQAAALDAMNATRGLV